MLPKTVNISIEDNDVRGKVIELQWKKYFMSLSQCSTSWSYQESETWLLQDEMILYIRDGLYYVYIILKSCRF